MSQKASRRKLADAVAKDLLDGKPVKQVMDSLAAYLTVENRLSEQELIVRDIENALSSQGLIVADVTTAKPLNDKTRADIISQLPSKKVELREHVDPEVIGGMKLEFSGQRYDATLARKIATLTTLKV